MVQGDGRDVEPLSCPRAPAASQCVGAHRTTCPEGGDKYGRIDV